MVAGAVGARQQKFQVVPGGSSSYKPVASAAVLGRSDAGRCGSSAAEVPCDPGWIHELPAGFRRFGSLVAMVSGAVGARSVVVDAAGAGQRLHVVRADPLVTTRLWTLRELGRCGAGRCGSSATAVPSFGRWESSVAAIPRAVDAWQW